ncbi:ATP-binding protein [Paraburkholderia sp. 40]|uniref:ATP-binding protein n=1 Tax=Paraburkholderia sp. 40 TaxID=2991059 RepID=UPI003D1B5CA1
MPTSIDLAGVLADEIDELRAVHSDRQIELQVRGNLHGVWDGRRLQQLLQNLVLNAIKYGAQDTPVRVEVTGDATQVYIDVRNSGPAIEHETLARIFDPLTREPSNKANMTGRRWVTRPASNVQVKPGGLRKNRLPFKKT